ncbi:MAG TPA: endonuclease/exonuclease/phosphatase family protein [Kofleriaceae bacterium]|nr:endonuclease/exonuclease/phosphatase family protein [Kofleriaceae bacterium]
MKALLVLLAACTPFSNDGTAWQALSTITGELAPEQGPDPAPRELPCTLHVVTFNVHFADDVANLAAQIQASQFVSQADVISIQEIRRYTNEPESRAQHLAELLGMTWIYAPAHTVDGGGVHGLAILSKFPLAHAEMKQLPYMDYPEFPEQRIALRADLALGDVAAKIIDVHLDTRLPPSDRIRQLDPALYDAPERTIIGGDFNTLPWTWVGGAVPLISSEAVTDEQSAKIVDSYFADNGFTRAVEYDAVTARAPVFDIRLDNIYARTFTPLGGDVEHVDGSDHWPVWFDIDRCH